jgi:ABC-type lipoprotein release transport system permease subunit
MLKAFAVWILLAATGGLYGHSGGKEPEAPPFRNNTDALGIPASLFIGRLMNSLLFHVSGFDPVILAAASTVLAICAAGAAFIPAMRAASVDPVRALRTD